MSESKSCPQCTNSIPVHKGFVTWCDKCDWNLSPSSKNSPTSILTSFHKKISNKYSHSLFNEINNSKKFSPHADYAKITGFVLAGIVHCIPLCFFAGGLFLSVFFWPNIFAIIAGSFLIAIAWFTRPRLYSTPKNIASKEKLSELHSLVESVCQHLGSSNVDGIIIDGEFNASMASYGFKRKRILTIGLPLWNILSHEEKLALLGHEIAHTINRDPQRQIVVASAVGTLVTMHEILYPEYIWPPDTGFLGIGAIPFTLLSLGLSKISYFGALVLLQVMWQSSQRAEYYADYLSTKLAGKDGALQLLNKLHYSHIIDHAVHKASLNGKDESNVFVLARTEANQIPQREIERLLRIDKIQLNHITTHPPTYFRIEFLKQNSFNEGLLKAEDYQFEKIEKELEPHYEKFNNSLKLEYRDGLYQR